MYSNSRSIVQAASQQKSLPRVLRIYYNHRNSGTCRSTSRHSIGRSNMRATYSCSSVLVTRPPHGRLRAAGRPPFAGLCGWVAGWVAGWLGGWLIAAQSEYDAGHNCVPVGATGYPRRRMYIHPLTRDTDKLRRWPCECRLRPLLRLSAIHRR